jgi:hypothetical protein
LRAGASLTQSRGLPSKALFGSAYVCWQGPVFTEPASVGLDVHARSVVAAAIGGVRGEVFRARLSPGSEDVFGLGPVPGMRLARFLRLDEIVSVTSPPVEREAARDLVRAREDVRGDLMAPDRCSLQADACGLLSSHAEVGRRGLRTLS